MCIILPKLQIGGAEMHVLSLLKEIDPSRFAVSLMCLNPGDDRMEEEARRYVESFVTMGFRIRRCPVSLAKMAKFLKAGRFDVVHCHLPPADSIGRLAGWLAGVPVILTTEHGKFLWKPWYYLVMERMLGAITDARICVSRDIMEIRRRREGTPERKLVFIPNAVDTARFRKPSRDRATVAAEFGWDPAQPLVIAVGRLEPEKNYELLVRAIDRLRARFPSIRCLLVGDGRCRAALASLVDSLGLASRVTLTGARADIPDLLGAADVFVLSSLKEGLPVSLLEAMAAGRGIVATSVGGIPETIRDGESGLLVPSGDLEALAGGIGRLLADGELRARLGRSALAEVERGYDAGRIVDRIESLYEETYRRKVKS
ncbi:MAG: glycosyltransferase [Candidatus Krumholzibacteria bacterium]|nr:glycosyltransferase [Candidatus Krumholzibacteria bacterium]